MRLRHGIVVVALAIGAAPSVAAAELSVRVTDARGKPAPDAVIAVTPMGAVASIASREGPTTKTIDQRNETFVPYVEIFRPGDQVVFRNSDKTRHHAYSFSPTKSFEMVLRPGEASTAFVLDRTGVVAVGCNIHDQMITYLYVSDAPWIARSGADGGVKFADLPVGTYSVQVWHPQLRVGQREAAQSVSLSAPGESKATAFSLQLLPDPRQSPDRERAKY